MWRTAALLRLDIWIAFKITVFRYLRMSKNKKMIVSRLSAISRSVKIVQLFYSPLDAGLLATAPRENGLKLLRGLITMKKKTIDEFSAT